MFEGRYLITYVIQVVQVQPVSILKRVSFFVYVFGDIRWMYDVTQERRVDGMQRALVEHDDVWHSITPA